MLSWLFKKSIAVDESKWKWIGSAECTFVNSNKELLNRCYYHFYLDENGIRKCKLYNTHNDSFYNLAEKHQFYLNNVKAWLSGASDDIIFYDLEYYDDEYFKDLIEKEEKSVDSQEKS